MPRAANHAVILPAPATLPPLSRLLVGLALVLARVDDRRRTRRALARLEPHLLRDIGVTEPARAAECAKTPWSA